MTNGTPGRARCQCRHRERDHTDAGCFPVLDVPEVHPQPPQAPQRVDHTHRVRDQPPQTLTRPCRASRPVPSDKRRCASRLVRPRRTADQRLTSAAPISRGCGADHDNCAVSQAPG
jgi:hypothetical protein